MRTWIAFCLQMASKFLLDALQGQMRWSMWICFGWRWDVMPKAPKIIFCGPFLPKFQLLSSELHDFNWQKGMNPAKHHYWERSIKKQSHHPCSIDGSDLSPVPTSAFPLSSHWRMPFGDLAYLLVGSLVVGFSPHHKTPSTFLVMQSCCEVFCSPKKNHAICAAEFFFASKKKRFTWWEEIEGGATLKQNCWEHVVMFGPQPFRSKSGTVGLWKMSRWETVVDGVFQV